MNAVLSVIRREYLQRVLNKWFIIGTIAAPLLLGLMFIGPILLGMDEEGEGEIAVVDETGVLGPGVVDRLGEGSFEPELIAPSPTAEQEQRTRIDEGQIFGYVVLDAETLASGTATFTADGRPGTVRRIQLQQAIVRTVMEHRLGETGDESDLGSLLGGGDITWVDLGAQEAEGAERGAQMVVGFAAAMIIYMTLLLYGMQVMRSVVEEKTSRIVEVIISSIEPWQLMLGKIVGVGGVALTQLGIWVGTVALLASTGIPMLIAARPEMAELGNLVQYLPAAGAVALFFVYFILGFFMFSGLYAAVAAMCSSDEEIQQLQMPVTILIVIPILFIAPIMEDPNGPLATGLSLVPFFSPIVMFPRFMGGAPLWQVGLSIVLLLLTILAVAWVAGRIYKVGILMQGKRPTLPELWRWVREA